jgi:hypothetical protein
LNSNSINNSEDEILEEQALFSGQFKGKCRDCSLIGHKSFYCKNHAIINDGNNGNLSGGIFCLYCCKAGHDKNINSIQRRRKPETTIPVTITVILTGKTMICKMSYLLLLQRMEHLAMIFGFVTVKHFCKLIQGMFNLKDIAEAITVGNGNTMMGTKVGSLKRHVIQLNGSTLDITINEVKLVHNLCAISLASTRLL